MDQEEPSKEDKSLRTLWLLGGGHGELQALTGGEIKFCWPKLSQSADGWMVPSSAFKLSFKELPEPEGKLFDFTVVKREKEIEMKEVINDE